MHERARQFDDDRSEELGRPGSGSPRHARVTTLEALLSTGAGRAARRIRLIELLDAQAEENAANQANAWIKSLRHARVDSVSFRERFTYRGESLWWFAELYLHKERAVLSLFRTISALSTLLDREAPAVFRLESGGAVTRMVAAEMARIRGIKYEGRSAPSFTLADGLAMDARSTSLMIAAVGSPGRPWSIPRVEPTVVAAFVHRAFWRGEGTEANAESYIGPVLEVLNANVPAGALRHVSVGPAINFRARRWWRRGARKPGSVQPIEHLVPRTALAGSTGVWAARHSMRRSLDRSTDLRQAAIIKGCDCWPVVAEALAGIALLQFPWSARAMDEAGAALDALAPSVALTYAEAGGWGRALALEARRRQIPLVGLQHGFIYRHWLNYLHEPDEMRPLSDKSSDRGFPRPAITLVDDDYAASHLIEKGRFPVDSVAVTGSPRLDGLAAAFQRLTGTEIDAARASGGAEGTRALVLLVTKYSEVSTILPSLLDAVRSMPDIQLAIKTHPAETPEPYEAAAAGLSNVRVLPASAPLPPLLRASQAVVTVNSTVALDAMALGVPALTIGLPNNLSPFVDAGAIVGAATSQEIGPMLRRLLYDHPFRQQSCAASAAVVEKFRMAPAGGAAEKQASIIMGLTRPSANQEGKHECEC